MLKAQGYEVIGMFMKNWHDDSVTISDECHWFEDSIDAMIVAQNLGIPFQAIDLSKEYKERIVDYMFDEYQKGRTPNPDVLCNREIKFDIFLKAALRLKADFIATGHYCRKDTIEIDGIETHRLLAGKDHNKDQSYFLCQLTQEQLSKALFPIGELTKPEVREIAKQIGLVTADKKDSQGLCFIGKVRLPDFLQQKLEPRQGTVIEIPSKGEVFVNNPSNTPLNGAELSTLKTLTTAFHYSPEDGKKVGEHNGAHYYTIGQRKGLNIGGTPEPLFIIDTDTEENVIYTGQGEKHPGLYRRGLFIAQSEVHWVRPDLTMTPGESMDYLVRIRYRQPFEKATLFMREDGLYIIFEELQKAIASGQFAVWYQGDELVGSGVIS